jgi:hypothetical protein
MSRTYKPTEDQRRQIELMAGVGCSQQDIALIMGIDPKTLRRACRIELDRGAVKANAKVAANLYRMATGTGREALIAAIFWMKTRCGWSEFSPPRESLGLRRWKQQVGEAPPDGASGWADLIDIDPRSKPN